MRRIWSVAIILVPIAGVVGLALPRLSADPAPNSTAQIMQDAGAQTLLAALRLLPPSGPISYDSDIAADAEVRLLPAEGPGLAVDLWSDEADLRTPLSATDAMIYRRIFALQEAGDFDAADAQIAKLDDHLLDGHVLFQRYMHPSAYRSTYDELYDWLVRFGDQPGADRIHRLASVRWQDGAPYPPRPGDGGLDGFGGLPRYWSLWELIPDRVSWRPNWHGSRGLAVVSSDAGTGWNAMWWRGLNNWRAGYFESALSAFSRLALRDAVPDQVRAAAAFWAARASRELGDQSGADIWLRAAAEHGHLFYGALANRALGRGGPMQDFVPASADFSRRVALSLPAGRRAAALLQIGRPDLAEGELRTLYGDIDTAHMLALIDLADPMTMPGLTLRLAGVFERISGLRHWVAAYPLPSWHPVGGASLDRALLFAIIHSESAFDPGATSHAGAQGAMQLMPPTARAMAARMGGAAQDPMDAYVDDPHANMALGQAFVHALMEIDSIDDDLIRLIAAYNAGPGNLRSWDELRGGIEDPLLYIERIPVPETRQYVKSVLFALWCYRERLGQPPLSLEALAEGRWPRYVAQDGAGD